MMDKLRVTVFGGSSPKPGEPAYRQALELGQLLGAAGLTVLTGGYMGTMEAVSRGVAEAGGHVIGITCAEIESWRPAKANPWVMEEIQYPTLRERLYALIDGCDAAIALPGGIGTLAEIAAMWSQLQVSAADTRPLILVGAGWEETFQVLFVGQSAYISEKNRKLVQFATDVTAAFALLHAARFTLHSSFSA
jgi:uncharacterized protein (TIGR00730 family)